MAGSQYQYQIEVFNAQNQLIHQSQVTSDWLLACEAARFQMLREGAGASTGEEISPVWHPEAGAPHISGVRVAATNAQGRIATVDIPLAYFRPFAQRVGQSLVAHGRLVEGEEFVYLVNAYPIESDATNKPIAALTLERIATSPIHGMRPLRELANQVDITVGTGDQAFPVFVPRSILAEAEKLKQDAGGVETGGILIGRLFQDPGSMIPFSEITAFLPARFTTADATRLTFTPETWSDARAAIDLRGRGESWLGWVHTHPARFWCKCSEIEKKVNCPFSEKFFSADDALLHRSVFYGAHHIAIVLGDEYRPESGWQTHFYAYGWRSAVIEARSVFVVGDAPRLREEERATNWGDVSCKTVA